jgi:thiamine biosynthesis protein ThiS
MRIRVNGKEMKFESPLTVEGLLDRIGVNPKAVVVERNLEILDRKSLGGEPVKEGDSFEIIRFVGGG